MFGYVLGSEAEIKNLGLINPNIINGANGTGALVGVFLEGTVNRCFIKGGEVSGSFRVGGLVGDNISGNVIHSYNHGTQVSCEYNYGGGIVGKNGGEVSGCYSTGGITGTANYIGGLAGYNFGTIQNCYSTGTVIGSGGIGGFCGQNIGSITGSFWDLEASQRPYSYGGVGLTREQMMTRSIFAAVGWDFVDRWGMGDCQTYPYLRRYSPCDINCDGIVNLLDWAKFSERWLTEGIQ